MRYAVLIFWVFCACKRSTVSGANGELRLNPARLPFPNAFVGQTKHARLELTNTAPFDMSVHLATSAPFAALDSMKLPGATTSHLDLDFIPDALGSFERELVVEDGEGRRAVATLTGVADPDPQCATPSPCRTSAFERTSFTCVETPLPDGLDCANSNPCLQTAQCIAGECIGTAVDCDDHDACTTDVCERIGGCVHFAATARCAASSDPCHAPACDPQVGCTLVDAPDGTRCGPADCSSAEVCLSGTCKRVTVHEGALCGDLSPCQPRGVCMANRCERPAARGLVTAWTVWEQPGDHIEWGGVADLSGNVYWRKWEALGPSMQLVSVTSLGVPRWSIPIPWTEQIAVVDGVLVLRQENAAVVEGRRISDGALLWRRDFNLPTGHSRAMTIARGLGGSLYTGIARDDGGIPTSSLVSSLNVFDGAPLWQVTLGDQNVEPQSSPVDEGGYLYLSSWHKDGKRRFASYSPSGTLRWSFTTDHAGPAATFGGRVYHWDHWISETTDAGFVNYEPPRYSVSGFPRLALGAITYVGAETVDAGSCGDPTVLTPSRVQHLMRVDPASSMLKWDLTISGPDGGGRSITNPVLTSQATVVFSQTRDYCDTGPQLLREVSAFGELGFSCELPAPESYFGEGMLLDGLWISALVHPDGGLQGVRAIELPGFQLPEHGWATAWGSSMRDNHAR